jgi:hypothetical protein
MFKKVYLLFNQIRLQNYVICVYDIEKKTKNGVAHLLWFYLLKE